jgi:hypothetical protein
MYILVTEDSHCARACPEEKIIHESQLQEEKLKLQKTKLKLQEIEAEESACEAETLICDIITKLVTPKCDVIVARNRNDHGQPATTNSQSNECCCESHPMEVSQGQRSPDGSLFISKQLDLLLVNTLSVSPAAGGCGGQGVAFVVALYTLR